MDGLPPHSPREQNCSVTEADQLSFLKLVDERFAQHRSIEVKQTVEPALEEEVKVAVQIAGRP